MLQATKFRRTAILENVFLTPHFLRLHFFFTFQFFSYRTFSALETMLGFVGSGLFFILCVFLSTVSLFILCFCVFDVFSSCLFMLSVGLPVHLIAWKDLSPK